MSFTSVLKNKAISSATRHLNKTVHSGLKSFTGGNKSSIVNTNGDAMQQKTNFTTKNITYPLNVDGDPMQGHYIMFMINESDQAQLRATKSRTFTSVKKSLKKEANIPVGGHAGRDEGMGFIKMDAVPNFEHIAGQGGNPVGTHQILDIQQDMGENKSGGRGMETTSLTLKKHSTTRLDTAISLYMPPSVNVQYGVNYGDQEVGVIPETGSKIVSDWLANRDMGEAWATAKSGATQTGKEWFQKKLPRVAQGGATVVALHRGAVITPRMELMIEGVGRRSFNYTFVFIPKSPQESKIVENIIYAFKFHMHPAYNQDVAAGFGEIGQTFVESLGIETFRRELTIPSTFDIAYMHQTDRNSFLNKISTCFLKSMDVQYGRDRFTAYEPTEGIFGSGAPPQKTQITLGFTELEIITKERIAEGF